MEFSQHLNTTSITGVKGMEWLISANPKIYDHISAFNALEKIDWKQGRTKFQPGDIVYIYASLPEQRITHRCVVEQINIEPSNSIEDKKFWFSEAEYLESKNNVFTRLRLLNEFSTSSLSLELLQKNGLNGNPQGRRKLVPELLAYIESQQDSIESHDPEVFNKLVKEALVLSTDERRKRRKVQLKHPKRKLVTTYMYERNPYVVVDCLERAKGICEQCNNLAPFKRKSNSSPYLEVHHITPLNEGGEDTLENVIAICPNCHRECHFG